MNNYCKIINNEKYIYVMNKIDKVKFITNDKWDWEHGLYHSVRVSYYIREILTKLGCNQRVIELGMISALLHDIGLSTGYKKEHPLRSSYMLDEFIQCTDITAEEKEEIRFAILNHSDSCENNSLLGIALYLADKLDMTYHRTINSSIQDSLNKELQKIVAVYIDITKDELMIKYKTTDDINFEVFSGWTKMIDAPKKAATSLGRRLIFVVNDKEIY